MKNLFKINILLVLFIIMIGSIFVMFATKGAEVEEDSQNNSNTEMSVDIESSELFYPMSGFVVTANYGYYAPYGISTMHYGTDIDVLEGGDERIFSMGSGYVYDISYNTDARGNAVYMLYKLNNGELISVCYFHLSSINISLGDEVNPNTQIGVLGTTGNSTGEHLHIEIAPNMSGNPSYAEHNSKRVNLSSLIKLPSVGVYQGDRTIWTD